MKLRTALVLLALPLGAAAALLPPLPGDGRLHGQFSQSKHVAGLKQPARSQGAFALVGAEGLVWRTEKPLVASVVLAKSGFWALDSRGARKLAGGAQALAVMRQVLSRDEAALQRDFRVRSKGTANAWTLDLEPKDAAFAKVIKSLQVKGGAHVKSLRLSEANGDRTEITFSAVAQGEGELKPQEAKLLGR